MVIHGRLIYQRVRTRDNSTVRGNLINPLAAPQP